MPDEIKAVLDEYKKWLEGGAIKINPVGKEPIQLDTPYITGEADVEPSRSRCECGHDLTVIHQMQGQTGEFPAGRTVTVKFFECASCLKRYVLKLDAYYVALI